MKKILFTTLLGCAALSSAAITPKWLRDVRISPDGNQIAFCYKGDIYTVPATGGEAHRLTFTEAHECLPVWSPDSKSIAYASDQHGSFDIFLMPAKGGKSQRLTSYSGRELPSAISPDGQYVYYSAAIQDPATSVLFPSGRLTELYRVPLKGGRSTQVLGTPAEKVSFTKGGQQFLYQDCKGGENIWRKHHTSSITRDVWLYDVPTGKHTNLTAIEGEDRDPVWSSDEHTVYFLSERKSGSFNVYSFSVDQPQKVTAVSHFKTHPVRFLSIGAKDRLCYTYNGEIYTQQPKGKAQKVKIELLDTYENHPEKVPVFGKLSSAAVSPNGKEVAFTHHGEVFVTSVDYSTTKRITSTPEAEKSVTFGPDNRSIVYVSERDGFWNIYEATIDRKEDLNFANATTITEKPLFKASDKIERTYPSFSPDGKKMAFIENRNRLMVMDVKTKKLTQLTDGSAWHDTGGGFGYSWSPDSKWLTLEYVPNHHDPYTDIGVVSVDGGEVHNITGSGYFDSDPKFVLGGKAILFKSNRYGMRNHASWGSMSDALLVFLTQDAYDKYSMSKEDYELQKELEREQAKAKKEAEEKEKKAKKDEKKADKKKTDKEDKGLNIEWHGIEDRMVRLTPNSSRLGDVMIDAQGENLYYFAAFEKSYDLWKLHLRSHSTQLINKMNAPYAAFETADKGKQVFIISSSGVQKMTSPGRFKPVSISSSMYIDHAAERTYMFNHVQQQIQKRFYNLNMHGVNWKKMCDNYRQFLPYINNNYDFSILLSELLGELNVSHTGSGYFSQARPISTANLGLLYDFSYTGKGLRISEVVVGGPFDRHTSKVKVGDIVEKVDGQLIEPQTNIAELLNDKTRKKTLISLFRPSTDERWEEVILPISNGQMRTLLYDRWVKGRAAAVDSLSHGRLGYVHIQSMDDASFRKVYSALLGKYNNREGIVIDTRFNGGGRLHEDIEVLFSGKKYLTQVCRGKESCDMPSRRWNKPSIMIQCEANYSNAHGTPWVYQHKGIGKLVGMPVPGTMTSVNWETLQDRTLYFGIPVIGYRTEEGTYLENAQLEPDFKVANSPETVVKGRDLQLETAVSELLKQLDKK